MTTLNLEALREQAERTFDYTFIETEGPTTLRLDRGETSVWVHDSGELDGDRTLMKEVKTLRAYRLFKNPRQPNTPMQHKLTLARQSRYARLDGEILLTTHCGDPAQAVAYPKTKEEVDILLGALYDFHQVETFLQDGDEICLPNGKVFARVVGIHVTVDTAFENWLR